MAPTTQVNMKELGWKLLPWMANIVCALLVYWASQLNQQVRELQTEVQGLKEWRAETAGNRYTAKDHLIYADGVAKDMQGIWMKISDLQQTWLKDIGDIRVNLARLPSKDDIKVLDDRIREHEQSAAQRANTKLP